MTSAILDLQTKQTIPHIIAGLKKQHGKKRKGSKGSGGESQSDGEHHIATGDEISQSINWEFDIKDPKVAQKFGNFSTPTIIKMCSKFNKGRSVDKADGKKIADLLSEEMNRRLEEDEGDSATLIHSEVLKFDHVNGFLNIYLQNE